ncbi:MAG: cupin domain-containing protein [Chloroflexi bacterium]|nr:MAG: cupin domain-containing protein [Chloroflexota bacterium]
MNYEIIQPGKGIEYKWSSDHIFVKTIGELAEGRVSMVEDTLKPGFHLDRHYHKKMIEIFYILEGEVTLIFDDETVIASAGTTINVPPNVWHEAKSENGAKMLTVFSPAGFEDYLAELKTLSDEQFADEAFMQALNEKYDIWNE